MSEAALRAIYTIDEASEEFSRDLVSGLRRKPKEIPAADPDAAAGAEDELQQLRRRVAELTAEVASLRQQLAELQGG